MWGSEGGMQAGMTMVGAASAEDHAVFDRAGIAEGCALRSIIPSTRRGADRARKDGLKNAIYVALPQSERASAVMLPPVAQTSMVAYDLIGRATTSVYSRWAAGHSLLGGEGTETGRKLE
jgi:hypothetical protein